MRNRSPVDAALVNALTVVLVTELDLPVFDYTEDSGAALDHASAPAGEPGAAAAHVIPGASIP